MSFLIDGARRAKRIARAIQGEDLFLSAEIHAPKVRLGNDGAAWCVLTDVLTTNSVVYSAGIGEDISFDVELIKRFGVHIHAFDPTPRSLAWLKSQKLPEGFEPHEYGLADRDGAMTFLPPEDANHVSYTSILDGRTGVPTEAPVQRLSSIMTALGHSMIDLLKMDIEGAEYSVIEDILSSHTPVRQLLVEFHHSWPHIGVQRTQAALKQLRLNGYRIFDISPSGSEISFYRA